MLCSVRCDELGTDPTVLADIDIDIDRPAQVRETRPLKDRVGGGTGGRLRYFGTCWSGRWAPINQLLLPLFPLTPDKAVFVLILSASLLLQIKSLAPVAGSTYTDQ